MSILPLSGLFVRPADRALRTPRQGPWMLGLALVLLVGYAAFSHGGASASDSAWIQVVLAGIGAVAFGAMLWGGGLGLRLDRRLVTGVAMLAAFVIWSGASLAWSVAPDATWSEFNRDLTYILMLGLALLLGSRERRALSLATLGLLIVALMVTAYALGQKVVPGLHVTGLFSLDQTGQFPRLQEPLGYWNALALFITMAVPGGLALVLDTSRTRRLRLAGLIASQCMLVVIAFTFSRGGLIALAFALGVMLVASRGRLRALMWVAIACVGAVPPVVYGLTDHALSAAGVPLASRESAGAILLALVVACALALVLGGRVVMEREERTGLTPATARLIRRSLTGAVVVAVVAGLVALALSHRGLTGTVSHAWQSFTSTRVTSNDNPSRLLSADSENRWIWWNEAAGAFSARPLTGWGAGSFPVVHLLYRRNTLTVNQPHSVPLQFLAETGVVGAVLALAGLALLLAACIRALGRLEGRQRLLATALLAAAVAYLVHELYDWDWDIPAVTLPALLALGVLGGAGAAAGTGRRQPPLGIGGRTLAIILAALAMCTIAISGALPAIAASRANDALVQAGTSSTSALSSAAAAGRLASTLDPLSDAGLKVQATVAERQGNTAQAQRLLLDALRRDPSDRAGWQQLALLDLVLGQPTAARNAGQRALELDPESTAAAGFLRALVQQVTVRQIPPRDSPTATPSG